MYLHRHDEVRRLAVWLFDGATDAEWGEHFQHLAELSKWHRGDGKRAAAVLIGGTFDRPDAKRRAELARLTEAPGYDPYVAFVMPNRAMRGVLTMMGWVQKAPKYEMSFFANTDEARLWLDGKRPDGRVPLQAMVDEVHAERLTASPAR